MSTLPDQEFLVRDDGVECATCPPTAYCVRLTLIPSAGMEVIAHLTPNAARQLAQVLLDAHIRRQLEAAKAAESEGAA